MQLIASAFITNNHIKLFSHTDALFLFHLFLHPFPSSSTSAVPECPFTALPLPPTVEEHLVCEPAQPLVVPISSCNDPLPAVLWAPPASHNVLKQLPVARASPNWSLRLCRTSVPKPQQTTMPPISRFLYRKISTSSSLLAPLTSGLCQISPCHLSEPQHFQHGFIVHIRVELMNKCLCARAYDGLF